MNELHITRWNETFENSDSRKRERLKYFYCPSGCDSRGYLALVSRFPQPDALMAFGVFQALCQLSATFGRQSRGRFMNSDGTPMEVQQLACLLRLDGANLSAAVQILTDEKVRWLAWTEVSPQTSAGIPADTGEQEQRKFPSTPEFPELESVYPLSTAELMQSLINHINENNPSWKKRPHFTRAEMDTLQSSAAFLSSLDPADWALLRAFMWTRIPEEWGKFWKPTSRGKFIETISDVLSAADKWKIKCKREGVATGLETTDLKTA